MTPRDLYLDLMKRCLTNMIYGDENTSPFAPPEYDPVRRAEARDWPARAHTMIGRARLDNIEQLAENDYRISMAVAGFGDKDLSVEVKEGVLTITGKRAVEEPKTHFLYQGIASRAFERRFQLADHMEVKGARLEHGLLHVDIARVIPEEKKARKISISSTKPEPKIVEATVADAA